MKILSVKNISKEFINSQNQKKVLKDISFEINKNEVLGIRGGNGTGKTTLFKIIANIEKPTSGNVIFEKDDLKLGVVFQNYTSTLLPWMSVKENIILPLKINSDEKVDNKLKSVIEKLNFNSLPLDYYPNQLSGGQRQRVAIARALIDNPDILILDEPFSNIDFKSSIELQQIINKICFETELTVIIVSHKIDEVMFLADRILILSERPSTITKNFYIPFSRPRNKDLLTSSEFTELRNNILEYEYERI